jgi:antitoxin YefM
MPILYRLHGFTDSRIHGFTAAAANRARAQIHGTISATTWSVSMEVITYTAVRASLAGTMDRVCNDHEPVIVTRNGEQAVVLISLEDYKALEETAYLLRSPENARRLHNATEQLVSGLGHERTLLK